MIENFNYSHISRSGRGKVGCVGECKEGPKLRIIHDKKTQLRLQGNMMGYLKKKDAPKETFTEDDSLHTNKGGLSRDRQTGLAPPVKSSRTDASRATVVLAICWLLF